LGVGMPHMHGVWLRVHRTFLTNFNYGNVLGIAPLGLELTVIHDPETVSALTYKTHNMEVSELHT
jgi:hypothetical protein